ncbi:MAG: hypothetical protein DHS80DRAFT_24397 [Piptocephalis tieghemiana]|nr:MAG: hypothetical protein DHS80DRAFT_24397 [Piptocephalis tieghemiana]
MLSRILTLSARPAKKPLQASVCRRTPSAPYSSSSSSSSTEGYMFKEEGFSSPAWKVSLVTVVGMVALIQHADYVTEGGKKEHPLTQYLRGQMPDEKEVARLEEKHIVETEREARLNLMQANHRSATMHTPVYPE